MARSPLWTPANEGVLTGTHHAHTPCTCQIGALGGSFGRSGGSLRGVVFP